MMWKYFIGQHSENLGKVCNWPTKSLFVRGLAIDLTLNISTHLELGY